MASTFFGLNIGVTGMSSYQVALNTTAHNLSNAGKAGYSKQTVTLTAENALSVPSRYGMIGSGVRIVDITQQRNIYYDDKFRYNTSIQAEYETKEYYLSCIQSYLYSSDETVAGMTTSFDNFFNSLTTMTSEASDMVKRTDAAILSETFVKDVGDFANALQTLQDEANTQIETVVSQINALGSSIASVTQQINTYEITGETANDLRDERNVLLDELSKYVNISTKETAPVEGTGNPQFLVYINGALLVDSTHSYSLRCTAQDTSINQCDIDNLFKIEWNNGQGFNMRSKSLGGELQALIEFRDGNNENNFRGTAGSVATEDGVTKVTVKNTNFNDLFVLSIPESKGRITIANVDYEYDSFSVNIAEDGTYEYEFTLRGEKTQSQIETLQYACDHSKSVLIGESISYKGVPYYMAKLNEFTRTFSAAFNKVHNEGYDLDGNSGVDWFNVKDKVTSENYVFDEGVVTGFESLAQRGEDGKLYASYYTMTGMNFSIQKELLENPRLIACMKGPNSGVEDNSNLVRLNNLKADNDMFTQGTPDAFLRTLISAVGIDGKQAKSMAEGQSKVIGAIDNRRISVSGVDKDEEAASLVKFRELLFSQYKVVSVMNEVLDKLINGMAV